MVDNGLKLVGGVPVPFLTHLMRPQYSQRGLGTEFTRLFSWTLSVRKEHVIIRWVQPPPPLPSRWVSLCTSHGHLVTRWLLPHRTFCRKSVLTVKYPVDICLYREVDRSLITVGRRRGQKTSEFSGSGIDSRPKRSRDLLHLHTPSFSESSF